MRLNLVSILALSFLATQVSAQRVYTATTHDLILSQGQTIAADSIDVSNPTRLSAWFNGGYQFHADASRSLGFYTGIHLRNVGLVTRIDTLRIKHRAYSLGIPVALKIGDIDRRLFVAPGAEVEFMFNYKVKEFVRGRKVYKQDEWLSDKVEMFNPSLFFQISLGGWGNVKVKYYLKDFLKPDPDGSYKVHVKGGSLIPGYARESKLFYVSWGSTFLRKKKSRKPPDYDMPPIIPERRNNDA